MKKLTLLALLLTAVICLAAVPPPPNLGITWQYGGIPTNTVFKVYGTTNLTQNITNWPTVATFTTWSSFTNGTTITYSNSFFSPPAASFFSMTSSNFWGESSFTTPVSVPNPAQTPGSLGLQYIGP